MTGASGAEHAPCEKISVLLEQTAAVVGTASRTDTEASDGPPNESGQEPGRDDPEQMQGKGKEKIGGRTNGTSDK